MGGGGMSWCSAAMQSQTPNSGCAKQTQAGGMIPCWTSQGSLHGPLHCARCSPRSLPKFSSASSLKSRARLGGWQEGRRGGPQGWRYSRGEHLSGSVLPSRGARLGAGWAGGVAGGASPRGDVGSTDRCMGTKPPGTGRGGERTAFFPVGNPSTVQNPVLSIPSHGSWGQTRLLCSPWAQPGVGSRPGSPTAVPHSTGPWHPHVASVSVRTRSPALRVFR